MNEKVTPLFAHLIANLVKKDDAKQKSTKFMPNVYDNPLLDINRLNDTVQPKLEQTVNEERLIDYRKFLFPPLSVFLQRACFQ